MLGLDANVVRKGSASCHVSPLSDAGIMSTTRTPGGGGGGGGEGAPSGGFGGRRQAATTQATAARKVVARMATGYTGGGPMVRSFAPRACRASKAGPSLRARSARSAQDDSSLPAEKKKKEGGGVMARITRCNAESSVPARRQ